LRAAAGLPSCRVVRPIESMPARRLGSNQSVWPRHRHRGSIGRAVSPARQIMLVRLGLQPPPLRRPPMRSVVLSQTAVSIEKIDMSRGCQLRIPAGGGNPDKHLGGNKIDHQCPPRINGWFVAVPHIEHQLRIQTAVRILTRMAYRSCLFNAGMKPPIRATIWKQAGPNRSPDVVRIRGEKSAWKIPGGVTLGLTLTMVERLNRRPFRLLDSAGTTAAQRRVGHAVCLLELSRRRARYGQSSGRQKRVA